MVYFLRLSATPSPTIAPTAAAAAPPTIAIPIIPSTMKQ